MHCLAFALFSLHSEGIVRSVSQGHVGWAPLGVWHLNKNNMHRFIQRARACWLGSRSDELSDPPLAIFDELYLLITSEDIFCKDFLIVKRWPWSRQWSVMNRNNVVSSPDR